MAKARHQGIHRPPVLRWLAFQTGIVILIGLAFLFKSTVASYSAFLGGFIFVLPNAYFARKAFRHAGARSAKQIVSSFYQGEAGKLILCAVLFTMAFKWIQPLDVAALFLTFAIMLVTNWLTPLLASGGPQRS
ncbi:F0F1 ATP synthase subunit I [Marinobacter nanhaiticus D15-8W]|uniref:F0F1 ATP synthase subunit I n=1 Tax=Marinobacter nanhaiticus D15-8W TaxID=626887 RepID=N6WWC1_9GAMM|nr:F0F1 ATP synthase subunit I [Marinobacter nanhaiticus]ENO15342.1 F0F1 ATP synthase subunit I [Marinobacter nanhaiticus D15-8W]